MYMACLWVKKALNINIKLCQMASALQKNFHTFKTSQSIDSKEISNLQQLHVAEYVYSNINPIEYPHLFKRYSYVWEDLIQQSVMCDYNSYDSLGLGGLKAMRNYFKTFIKQEGSAWRLRETNYKESELDGICTLWHYICTCIIANMCCCI